MWSIDSLTEVVPQLVPIIHRLDLIIKSRHADPSVWIIDTDRMVDKLDKYGRMLLPPTATSEQAIMALETLYNYHQRGNIVLFREALRNRK